MHRSVIHTREAVSEFGDEVVVNEVWAGDKAVMETHGASFDAVLLDDEEFRPDGPPWRPTELSEAIRSKLAGKTD